MLKLRVNANDEQRPMFLLELAYGGMFVLSNVPEDSIQPILLIECPRLLFPFARRIVADVVRDGGLPPLMIEPIDFVALYRSKMAEAQQTRVS
jgi:preprotein translocase subunit SecB